MIWFLIGVLILGACFAIVHDSIQRDLDFEDWRKRHETEGECAQGAEVASGSVWRDVNGLTVDVNAPKPTIYTGDDLFFPVRDRGKP